MRNNLKEVSLMVLMVFLAGLLPPGESLAGFDPFNFSKTRDKKTGYSLSRVRNTESDQLNLIESKNEELLTRTIRGRNTFSKNDEPDLPKSGNKPNDPVNLHNLWTLIQGELLSVMQRNNKVTLIQDDSESRTIILISPEGATHAE